MDVEEFTLLDKLSSVSDIPASLQFYHNEYSNAKVKLGAVTADTAETQRGQRLRIERDLRDAEGLASGSVVNEINDVLKPPNEELEGKLSAIEQFSRLSKYLGWVKFLQEMVQFFEKHKDGEGWKKCLPIYEELNCFCSVMESTKCQHLYTAMLFECNKWYGNLTAIALKHFGNVNWKKGEEVENVVENLKVMFKISSPLKHGEINNDLAMKYLLNTFRTQFKFHFMRKVKTNDITKPEWYLTKILSMVRENKDIFYKLYTPQFDNPEEALKLYVLEFCSFAVIKMEADIPKIDSHLFCHYIDEIISFHKELNKIVPVTSTPILELLTKEKVLKRWIHLETASSYRFLGTIQDDTNCWELVDNTGYKVPSVVIRVLTLVRTIGERVTVFSSLALSNCFYSLQKDLLQDFLIHITDVRRGVNYQSDRALLVVNCAVYVLSILEEWSYDTRYIQLATFNNELQPFTQISEKFTLFKNDSISSLEQAISSHTLSEWSTYSNQSWQLPLLSENISPACSPGLMSLQQVLGRVGGILPDELFQDIWSNVAITLQHWFINSMILSKQFTRVGAQQLQVDVKAFCSLFHVYCSPTFFSELSGVVSVLCMPVETVRVWRGEGRRSVECLQGLVEEAGVGVKVEVVIKVLQQRSDVA